MPTVIGGHRLLLVQTRRDEIAPAPEWLREQTTIDAYLRGALT